MTYEQSRTLALKRLPKNLNILGFEMSLLVNYSLAPSADRIQTLYKEYMRIHHD